MARNLTLLVATGISLAIIIGEIGTPAGAITVQVAQKCRALALKAHPYKRPGTKGPGSATAEREYYHECVAKGGPDEKTNGAQDGKSQNPAPPAK